MDGRGTRGSQSARMDGFDLGLRVVPGLVDGPEAIRELLPSFCSRGGSNLD